MQARLALWLLLAMPAAAAGSATLAVVNARVWTGDANRPWAAAAAVEGERIVVVGSDADVRAVCGPATRVVDARGGMVTPGFIDAHIHLMAYDLAHPLPPIFLQFVRGRDAVAERIAAYAAKLPKGAWILGRDWAEETWGGRLPSREWLDRVAPENPVWLVKVEGNTGIANSAALRAAGLAEPEGLVRAGEMWRVEAAIVERSRASDDALLEGVMRKLVASGVTSVHHNNGWYDFLILRRLHRAGRLPLRVYASPQLPAWERMRDYVAEFGRGDTWMHWGGLKGYGSIREDEYYRWVSGASRAGLQVMVHTGSEAELRMLVKVFARVREEQQLRDPRFRVEHGHDMPADVIGMMAKAGAMASWQPPLLAHYEQRTKLGVPPPKNLFPCRALLAAGVKIAFGTDTYPAVEMVTPLASLRMALERTAGDGSRIGFDEAMRAYTVDAAYAEFAEKEKGSLEAGKLADLVVFDGDIAKGAANVRMTVVGGRVAYEQ